MNEWEASCWREKNNFSDFSTMFHKLEMAELQITECFVIRVNVVQHFKQIFGAGS